VVLVLGSPVVPVERGSRAEHVRSPMSVVEELRRNDPARDPWIRIALRDHEDSKADLAQALEQNLFVTEIRFDLAGVRTTDWETLLRVIVMRENLGKVTLRGGLLEFYAEEERNNALPTLVWAFLRSIQQNNSIRAVDLEFLILPADVSTFLDSATSITMLVLKHWAFAPTQRDYATRDLAVALQRNTNIEHLKINFLGDIYAIPVLQALQSNVSLKDLEITKCMNAFFADDAPAIAFSAIQQLLESSTSITRFVLCGYMEFSGATFRPMAQGLIQSQSICDVILRGCQFSDEESTALLRSILQEKRNLASLCLKSCSFNGRRVDDATISALTRADSPLQNLEIEHLRLGSIFPNIQFENLLRAVEKSTLKRFGIGGIGSQLQLQTLAQSIPSMRLKELQVRFDANFDRETAKGGILQAVQSNFSLRSLTVKLGHFRADTDLFDDHDKERLEFYANRNEHLDQWADNPETVTQKVWPDALKLAERAGPDSLFRGLRSVLESDGVKLHARRKRKHPQFYAPS